MHTDPEFDTKAFVEDHWSGALALHRWLNQYGIAVEKQAVYKQLIREAIPTSQFAVMLALLEMEKGTPVSVSKYLRG